MTPSIAVVVPTCNRFTMLTRTLRSLEGQTYKDFTVYVSDDASTDETKNHDATSFPNLRIRWVRRKEKFPDIAAHFSALYAEATEDWIALAHDDEIYAPEWLETLIALMSQPSPSGKPIVMAQVGTVVVDARSNPVTYFCRKDQIPDGLYAQEELKRRCLFDGWNFSSNGFLVTREATCQIGLFNIDYEQFDFEWLMRLAGRGVTACSTRLLHTYTMHPENTVGSVCYLQRYFRQKNPSAMKREWLETLQEISTENKEKHRQILKVSENQSRFRSFLKLVASGERESCLELMRTQRVTNGFSGAKMALAHCLCKPIIFQIGGTLLRFRMLLATLQAHRSLQRIEPASWLRER